MRKISQNRGFPRIGLYTKWYLQVVIGSVLKRFL